MDGYRGLQLHKEPPDGDVGHEYGGKGTCSDACTGARNIAMCPSPALPQRSG